MRYIKEVLLIIGVILSINSMALTDQRWSRQETSYEVQKVQVLVDPQDGASLNSLLLYNKNYLNDKTDGKTYRGENLNEIVNKSIHKEMTEKEMWFVKEEIKFLNKDKINENMEFNIGDKIIVPQYKPFQGGRCCSDMRNIMVAVMKGKKYGVHWAYLIGVRSQENPSPNRDHYAYGVVCRKGTDLWTQAEWGAKILKRCTRNAENPSFSDIDRASHTYVGYETSEWPNNVWAVFNRCQLDE